MNRHERRQKAAIRPADRDEPLGARQASAETHNLMQSIAGGLDEILNPTRPKKIGFVVLVFPFGDDPGGSHRANYVSNARREDVVTLLKEQLAYFQGQPEMKGRA